MAYPLGVDAFHALAGGPFRRRATAGDTIDLSAWSNWVVVPVSLAASFALPVLVVLLWRCGRRREAMLPASLLLALLGQCRDLRHHDRFA